MPRKTTFIAGYIWGHHKTENLLEFMDLQTNNIDEPIAHKNIPIPNSIVCTIYMFVCLQL